MTRRIAASIALLGVAAIVTWLALGRDGKELPRAGTTSSPSTGARTEAESPAALDGVAASRSADAPAITADPWWSVLALEALRPQPPFPDGVPIRVLDDRTAVPEADALVFVIFYDSALGAIHDMRGATVSDLCSSGAPSFTTDGQGETRVKLSGTAVHLVGVKGDRWATVRVDESTPTPVELRLRASRALVVKSVDEHGAPRTGVPIRFGFKATPQSDHRFWFTAGMHAVSSEDGTARFTGVDRYPSGVPPSEWGLSLDCATVERTFVAVDRSMPFPDPVLMTVPAIGTVRVRVVDADGALVPLSGNVRLMSANAGSDPNVLLTLALHEGVSASALVGAGLRFNAFVETPAFAQLRADGVGPTADGEVATIDVPLPDPVQFDVVATLISEKGEVCRGPTGATFLAPTEKAGSWNNGNRELVADQDGIVHVPLGRVLMRHGPVRLAFRGTMPDGEQGFGSWIDVQPPEGSKREIDLGDVVLREAQLLAAGTVVDDADRPVSGAMVMCDSRSRGGSVDSPWRWLAVGRATTSSDGRFRFVSAEIQDAHEVELDAMARVEGWSVTGIARVPCGQSDVRLRVEARGSIAGSVLLPAGVDREQILVAVGVPAKGGEPNRWFNQAVPEAGGTFLLGETEPGSYRFAILRRTSRSTSAPLVLIDDVRVESRKVARDPRLDRIDLGGRVRCVSVGVTDGDGIPVTCGNLYVIDRESGAGLLDSIALRDKPARLLLDGRIDVLVIAPGFQRAWLRDVTGDGSVRLAKGLSRKIELDISGYGTLAEREVLLARLQPIDAPLVEEGDWPKVVADAHGAALFTVDDPGRYRVHVRRGERRLVNDEGQSLSIDPQIVTIDESAVPLTVEVHVAH